MTRLKLYLLCGLMLVANFVVLRMGIPSLINSHNDGLLVLAVLVGFLLFTADYIFIEVVRTVLAAEKE